MDRLIASNSVPMAQADTAPVSGTPQGATDGNPATNVPATRWPSYQYNAIQEELIAILTAAGITPDRTNNAQIVSALRRIIQSTVVLTDTGVANAYAAVNPTPLVSGASPTWVDGVIQQVKIAHANTGASTYSPDGLTPIPIYGLGLQPLQGSELFVGGTAVLMHATITGVNSGNPVCVLMECAGGAQQVAAATQSQHAVQMAQLFGGLKGISRFTTSGSLIVPAGVTTMYLSGCAGGAGGGAGGPGSISSSSAWASGGGGGGAGQPVIRQSFPVTPGQTITVTIGAAGAGGTASGTNPGNSGGTGGATTLSGAGWNGGTTTTLLGGGGGGGGNATTTSGGSPVGGGAGSGYPSGGYGNDCTQNVATGSGGSGGGGPFGAGGSGARTASSGLAGAAGYGFGAGGGGGSGIYTAGGGNGGTGGAGTPGLVILEW